MVSPVSNVAPRSNEIQWFYKTDSGKAGPVDTTALVALFEDRTLPPETLLWRHGLETWVAAADCPELSAAVAAARSRSVVRTPTAVSRRLKVLLVSAVLVSLPFVWRIFSWLIFAHPSATVHGTVATASGRVTGGSIVMSPIGDADATAPGKPGAAQVLPDGTYTLVLHPGSEGLARRARVRFSPPVLPVLPEDQAMTAVPEYQGLVPDRPEIDIKPGNNAVDIVLISVPGGARGAAVGAR